MRGIVNPVMQGINGLTVLIVIWYGGIRVMRGDLLVADIVAFIAYLNVLAWPTAAFGWMLSLVERGRAAMHRLEEILETEPEIADEAASAGNPWRSKKASNSATSPSLTSGRKTATRRSKGSISRFPSARSVGLVGRIGSGKSTVAQLVPRLFDVSTGEILLDGQDIRKLSLRDLRRMIGYVPQDPFLFLHLAQAQSRLRP